ncbi:hypothetical protein [Vibrio porteresiae]|uniref:Uncharacterized protein n=1 Tax=Vibrio porteresiae DSM 19223 TaxID=1123496 RepID=A0ABZ0Q7M2_9VIBR|nr:hypothetical protein [Vibrio porteresiae]WPC72428.1 hypothetical protein R8Z52_09785 [Vibrio porteresiae DSM 19223]
MNAEIINWIISGGLGGGIVSFILKSWFETRLKNSIKHEYDTQLIALKASIDNESQLVATLQNNFIHKSHISHERILLSIESLWSGILLVKKNQPSILTYVDVLVEKEFGTDFGTMRNRNLIDIKDSDMTVLFSDELNRKDHDRLYAGEYLWSLFFCYRQLVGRICIVIKKGREAKNVPLWWEDRICKQVISSICSNDELNKFNSLKFSRINWILNHIEQKYLQASNKIITGESSISIDADLAQKVLKAVENAPVDKNL